MTVTLRAAYLEGGAEAWEAAADMLASGMPAEIVGTMARANAAELRLRIAEAEEADSGPRPDAQDGGLTL